MCVVLEVPPYTGSDPSDSKGWERILNPRPVLVQTGNTHALPVCSQTALNPHGKLSLHGRRGSNVSEVSDMSWGVQGGASKVGKALVRARWNQLAPKSARIDHVHHQHTSNGYDLHATASTSTSQGQQHFRV